MRRKRKQESSHHHSVKSDVVGGVQLIVVDNGSTDATADILGNYTDPRITVLRPDRNLGVVGARNLALTVARGQYLAVHDADDISRPERFARQVEYLDSHPGCAAEARAVAGARRRAQAPGDGLAPLNGTLADQVALAAV